MEINKLVKLELIKYKNNNYRVFSHQNGRRIFLKELAEDSYIYPDLRIYLELDKIYNSKDVMIRYLKNKTVAKIINGALIVAGLSGMGRDLNLIKTYTETKMNISEVKKNTCDNINYDTARTLAYQSEDVFTILNNNQNITDNVKKYIKHFIKNAQKSNIDLTIFKRNLKDLKIVKKDKKEFESNAEERAIAYFDTKQRTIFYKEVLSPGTLYHELGHTLNFIYFKEQNAIYSPLENNEIGSALDEGFNSLFISEMMKKNINSYSEEQYYIRVLREIVGQKKVKACYLEGDNIVDALSDYDTKDEIKRTLMLMDDICMVSNKKDIKIEQSKNEIASKLMEWSIKSANKKYEHFKNEKTDFNLKDIYTRQLLNTDLMISNAFNLNLEQIKKLELQFLGDNEMEKEYKKILNSEDYLIKLIEQLERLNNKEQFMETGKTK